MIDLIITQLFVLRPCSGAGPEQGKRGVIIRHNPCYLIQTRLFLLRSSSFTTPTLGLLWSSFYTNRLLRTCSACSGLLWSMRGRIRRNPGLLRGGGWGEKGGEGGRGGGGKGGKLGGIISPLSFGALVMWRSTSYSLVENRRLSLKYNRAGGLDRGEESRKAGLAGCTYLLPVSGHSHCNL